MRYRWRCHEELSKVPVAKSVIVGCQKVKENTNSIKLMLVSERQGVRIMALHARLSYLKSHSSHFRMLHSGLAVGSRDFGPRLSGCTYWADV